MKELSENDLVPGRTCGACTACCRYFTIRDEALLKSANVLCRHCVEGQGCTIYDSRPALCRSWNCGWRRLVWVSDHWRPDLSGVLVRLDGEGTTLTLLIIGDKLVALGEEFLRVVGGVIRAGHAVSLSIPGPAGHYPVHAPLNEPLRKAVETRDLALARDVVGRIMGSMLQHHWEPDGVDPPAR